MLQFYILYTGLLDNVVWQCNSLLSFCSHWFNVIYGVQQHSCQDIYISVYALQTFPRESNGLTFVKVKRPTKSVLSQSSTMEHLK